MKFFSVTSLSRQTHFFSHSINFGELKNIRTVSQHTQTASSSLSHFQESVAQIETGQVAIQDKT